MAPKPQPKPIGSLTDWKGRPFFSTKIHYYVGHDLDDDGWTKVKERAVSHPEEVSRQGAFFGQTVLHLACYRFPPLDVIKILLKVCPEIASVKNVDGETPLHIAIMGSSEDVIEEIILANRQSVLVKDKHGETPFHQACRGGLSIEILRLMLSCGPLLVNELNIHGLNSMMITPKDYERIQSIDDITGDGIYVDEWEKMQLLVQVGASGCMKSAEHGTSRLLHAATKIKTPRAFLFLVALLFPEQLIERDENGDTPLSIAAATPLYEEPKDLEAHDTGEDFYCDHFQAKNKAVKHYMNENIIDFLSSRNPRAASIHNGKGRLPFAIAVESGKTWKQGLRSLLCAYPGALFTADSVTRLYPFMLAAVDTNSDLTTVYELTRALPELVSLGMTSRGSTQTQKNGKEIDSPTNGKKRMQVSHFNKSSLDPPKKVCKVH